MSLALNVWEDSTDAAAAAAAAAADVDPVRMPAFGLWIVRLGRCSYVQNVLVAVGDDGDDGDVMMVLSVAEGITCEIGVQQREAQIESCP